MARRYRRRRARRKLRRSRNEKVGMRMSLPRGGFRISRLCDLISVKRNTSGTFVASNTSVLSLGSPVASVAGVSGNYYDLPFAFTFRLNQVVDYSDIQNICDRYKMVRAQITFHSGNTSNVYGGIMPYIDYIYDTDDDTTPSNNSLRQKMGVRSKGYNQQGKLTLPSIPTRCAGLVLGNAGGTGFSVPSRSVWIDTAYDSVPHFGLKGIFRNLVSGGASTDNSNFSVDVKLTFICADLQ